MNKDEILIRIIQKLLSETVRASSLGLEDAKTKITDIAANAIREIKELYNV